MLLDSHIHIFGPGQTREEFLKECALSGIDGGVIISAPRSDTESGIKSAKSRIEELLQWTTPDTRFVPFFWIDVTEDDALAQVDLAISKGIKGFKAMCLNHYPGDERAIPVYQAIADNNKPILFHSGILWDQGASAKYNRPGNFEDLLQVDKLRFALAHISWPWCDECLAVYGKLENAKRRGSFTGEMFIDTCPGTPPIYRKDALTKIFTIGYNVQNNVLFGTDGTVGNFSHKNAKPWIDRDTAIYKELGLDEEARNKIFGQNLKRFLEG